MNHTILSYVFEAASLCTYLSLEKLICSASLSLPSDGIDCWTLLSAICSNELLTCEGRRRQNAVRSTTQVDVFQTRGYNNIYNIMFIRYPWMGLLPSSGLSRVTAKFYYTVTIQKICSQWLGWHLNWFKVCIKGWGSRSTFSITEPRGHFNMHLSWSQHYYPLAETTQHRWFFGVEVGFRHTFGTARKGKAWRLFQQSKNCSPLMMAVELWEPSTDVGLDSSRHDMIYYLLDLVECKVPKYLELTCTSYLLPVPVLAWTCWLPGEPETRRDLLIMSGRA